MEKKQSGIQNLKIKRNSLFYKTIQKNQKLLMEQLPPLIFKEAKTIKVTKKIINNFPVLNFFSSQAHQKIKCFSLQHKEFKKACSKRQKTAQIQRASSFISKQIIIEKLAQKLKSQINFNEQNKNDELKLPFISQNGSVSSFNRQNLNLFKQKSVDPKKKKQKKNIRCKVLLADKNIFPFTDRTPRENSLSNLPSKANSRFKRNENIENQNLFNLNISRIDQKNGFYQDQFISEESVSQIPIF